MEIRQLRYFIEVIDHGGISRAAQKLHIVQPALSQQIAKLEEQLGVQLLTRGARGVAPTKAGSALYRHAQGILRQLEQARSVVTQVELDLVGQVSIGIPHSLMRMLALPLLRRARAEYPRIQLVITEAPSPDLAHMVMNGKFDLAFLFSTHPIPGVVVEPLFEERLFFVSSSLRPRVKAGQQITLRSIIGEPLLLSSRPNGIRMLVEGAFAQIGEMPNVIAEINATSIMTHAVQAGVAASLMPLSALSEDPALPPLHKHLVYSPKLLRPVSLCLPDVPLRAPVIEIAALLRLLVASVLATSSSQIPPGALKSLSP